MLAARVSRALRAAFLLSFVPSACSQDVGTNTLKVVRLSGSAHQRGLIHGRQLQSEIRELVSLWKADLKSNFGIEPDTVIAAFLNNPYRVFPFEMLAPTLIPNLRCVRSSQEPVGITSEAELQN
jgi:hypothetical protein